MKIENSTLAILSLTYQMLIKLRYRIKIEMKFQFTWLINLNQLIRNFLTKNP